MGHAESESNQFPLVSLQAPLTTKDTAVLSGSLSTHNGNGGGTINLALRRVTSANGWGEVRLSADVWRSSSSAKLTCETVCVCVCVWAQVELGAGDTHGPLFGMKIFRNLTPRWWVWEADQRGLCSPSVSLYNFLFWISFVTAQCGLQFSSRGVRPGFTTVLARHLDKNTMGYLQWRWGIQSSMNTSIVRDTKSSHFTFAMQVSSQQAYFIFHFCQDLPIAISCQVFAIVCSLFLFAAWHSSHVCDDELPV